MNKYNYMELKNDENTPSIFEEVNSIRREQLAKVVKKARTSLYVISGIQIVFSFILYYFKNDNELAYYQLIAGCVISVIFAALGFLSNSKPYIALLIGLIIYSVLIISDAIYDPLTLTRGIILKIVIIVWLVKGIKSAYEIQKIPKTE